jgi:amino acid permease
MQQVTRLSVGFAAAVCVVIGVAGYLPFANGVCPDILNSFPRNDPATSGKSSIKITMPGLLNVDTESSSGARFLLAITMFLTYPMEFFVTRFAIISAIQRRWAHIQHKDNLPHYSVTAALWIVTTLLGTFSTDLGIILDITGSVAAVFLAFILPGWLCIKLDNLRIFSRSALKECTLIVVGSFFMIVSSLIILLRELQVIEGES